MSLGHGAKIVKDGLVFAYDMGSKQSWKGKPGHNYLLNGNFANGQDAGSESGSWGTYNIAIVPNPGSSEYVLRQLTGEYEMHFKSGYPIQPNTTYTLSCWVGYTPDWDGGTQIMHARYWKTDGTNSSIGGSGTLLETKQVAGIVWERRYYVWTTDALANGSFSWYLGYSAGGTTGWRYLTDVQIEEGNFPSPFIYNERPNTEALIDWAGGNSITTSSLTYNSDNTFSFNGSSNYLDVGSGFTETTLSIELMVKPGSSQVQYADIIDNNHTNSRGWVIQQNSTTLNQYYFYTTGSTVNFSLTANVWQHVVCTHNPSTNTKVIYINGEQVASGAAPAINYDGTEFLRLGRWGGGGRYWNGVNAMTRIYRRALSATEVKQNFNALRGRFGI